MVCFQTFGGSGDAQREARDKHYVLFDLPADKGAEFKAKQPDIGWFSDIEGHPALPFSVAARIILPMYAERDERDVGLFDQYPTAQLFARLWAKVVPFVD